MQTHVFLNAHERVLAPYGLDLENLECSLILAQYKFTNLAQVFLLVD